MSEPMTTVEIEDVLSSIRRLVSEDLRPTQRLVSAALQMGASKLILTPALRIVTDSPTGHSDQVRQEVKPQQSVTDDINIAVEEAEFTADILPVFGSVRLLDVNASTADASAGGMTDANFLASAMSRINGLTATEEGFGSPHQRGQSAENIEAVVATVGAAVGPDEWEVDGGDPSPQDNAWNAEPWNDKIDDVDLLKEHPVLLLGAGYSVAEAGITGETVARDTQADTHLTQDMHDDDAYDMGADSIVFNQDMAAGPIAAKSDPSDGTEYIDEDILRGIVRDMIRQELQGALGERITSNVRKLVRAEVNRALAAHVYDDKARA